ncbi:MAG: TolC family protein, partial [Deltaproteobacteria bacterium]|nr:TolC family protein [Deltaproteobacteria bacterium]
MVEADARIAELRLDKTVGDVILAVKESYYELLYIRNAKRVAHENLSLLNHLRKVGETAYAEDRAGLMDMVKAQSQLGQLRYDTLLLGELEHTEQTRLNSLLDRAPDAEVGELAAFVFRPLGLDLDQLYALAEKNQEGILMAEVKVKKAEANADLARYEGMPDFKVGIFYASIGDPNVANPPSNAGKDAVGVQVGMTLPLWFGKNTGRKKSAHAMMRTAKAETTARINKSREERRNQEPFFPSQKCSKTDGTLPRRVDAPGGKSHGGR